jgi:hypothetical protein
VNYQNKLFSTLLLFSQQSKIRKRVTEALARSLPGSVTPGSTGQNQHGDKTDIRQTKAQAAENEQAATQTIRAAIEALAGSQTGQKTT